MMEQRRKASSGSSVMARATTVTLVLWSGLWKTGAGFSTSPAASDHGTGLPATGMMWLPKPIIGRMSTSSEGVSVMRKLPILSMRNGREEFVPHPPDTPPTILPQLEQELEENQRRLMLYETELGHVRELLGLRQEELNEERYKFREESSSLQSKLADFTDLLMQKDQEKATEKAQRELEFQKREQALQEEVTTLTTQLEQMSKEYEKKAEAVTQLKSQLEEVQDALEFEQMNWEKEKTRLETVITQEKLSIKSMLDQATRDKASFDSTQKELVQRVKKEQEKVYKSKTAWEEARQALKEREDELLGKLKEEEAKLLQNKKTLANERNMFDEEREKLKQQIIQQTKNVMGAQQHLKSEQAMFSKKQRDLESKIIQEQDSVQRLQNQYDQRTAEYEKEKVSMELTIQEEKERVAELEATLIRERDEKEALEKKLANEIRVNLIKKRQMNERYTKIREDLTSLWEATKRENRKTIDRLTKKHDRQLKAVKEQVKLLEGELEASRNFGMKLRDDLADMTKQKDTMMMEVQALEDVLANRNAKVTVLEGNIEDLRRVIAVKDGVIKRYENSFRSLGRLSLKVSGNKIKSAGRFLKRIVQNAPPKELDE